MHIRRFQTMVSAVTGGFPDIQSRANSKCF